MKYKLIVITTFILYNISYAQISYNKPVSGKKTIWTHLGGSYQVDSYNINNDPISMVQVNGNGDTTQVMTYGYDVRGREIKHINRIGNRIESELITVYEKDSANITIQQNEKTKVSKHKLGLNDKPVFTPSEECDYIYNLDSSTVIEVCKNQHLHEVDSTIMKFDKNKNMIKQTYYLNNTWRWTDERKYDHENREVERVQTDVYQNKHITFLEYDNEGRLTRNYGGSNKNKWEMRYEYFEYK